MSALLAWSPPSQLFLYILAQVWGDHQVGCGGNGDRVSHHNAVWDILFSAAQLAALPPTKEALSLVPSSSCRPTGAEESGFELRVTQVRQRFEGGSHFQDSFVKDLLKREPLTSDRDVLRQRQDGSIFLLRFE